MLARNILRRPFSYNPLKAVTELFRAPVKHIKVSTEATGEDRQVWGNQTADAFDEVSQEWQAAIIGNTYDQHTQQYLDAHTQPNFGTIDNPHIIVTSDAPFRYVGCSGQPNEDDYEGHEFMVFMLREGSMQRCPACGQVYKLVRLRDEYSPEMDYYKSSTIPLDVEELGEADQWFQNSIIRMMPGQFETSIFEHRSNMAYSLANPDEHDRMLVDPAYRLEKLQLMEHKGKVMSYSLKYLRDAQEEMTGVDTTPASRTDYESLHEAEQSMARLERVFRRHTKFASRQFLDIENHERREKRMLERSQGRVRDSYTVYFGGLTENEAQYRDYFETDLESDPDVEAEQEWVTKFEIQDQPHLRLDRFDFQEMYTGQSEEDASGMLAKRMFEFKYRRAKDTPEVYSRREERLFNRTLDRMGDQSSKEVFDKFAAAKNSGDAKAIEQAQREVLKLFANEGVNQMRDYYETDIEEVGQLLDQVTDEQRGEFVKVFEDYARGSSEIKGYQSIPKRKWNRGVGFWSNMAAELADYRGFVTPRVEK